MVTCPLNDTTGICQTLEGTGAGLGVFLGYLQQALPSFLLILAIIGGVVAIFYAIAIGIKNSVGHGVRMR